MYTTVISNSIISLVLEAYWVLRYPRYIRIDINRPTPLTLIEI